MSDLCVTACKEAGWVGELAVFIFLAARTAWSERKRRQIAEEKGALQQQVQTLSNAPPPASTPIVLGGIDRIPSMPGPSAGLTGLVLHLPGVSLYPAGPSPSAGTQESLRPREDESQDP